MNISSTRSSRYKKSRLYPGIVILLAALLLVLLYQLDLQKSQLTLQEEALRTHHDIVRQLAEQTILLDSYRQTDLERLSTKLRIARVIVDMAPQLDDGEVVRLANVIHDESARYEYDWKWLLALIEVESNFNPKARSPVGACGLMQLMPTTARDLANKLKIKYEGKRSLYDLEQNVQIGAYYFHMLLKRFGDYEQAIAAYNHGPTGVIRSTKQGKTPASKYRQKILNTYARLAQMNPS